MFDLAAESVLADGIPSRQRYDARMAFPKPIYTRARINRAAQEWEEEVDRDPWDADKLADAYEAINNWRASHGYAINTFQMTLRGKLKKIDREALVAQRLKRFFSITAKLRRFKNMKLTTMQDIAGLRAVVHTMRQVRSLRTSYVDADHRFFTHELVGERNYIDAPKASGYRSIHLVYRYKNRNAPEYDGLLLELQLRTRLQHIWATTVETLGTLISHALKASSGPKEWLDFFSLASAAFAHLEKTHPVPGYENLSANETFSAVVHTADALHVRDRLQAYRVAADEISRTGIGDTYHLIVLDPKKKTTTVTAFSRTMVAAANDAYIEIEKKISGGEDLQAVLVSAGSMMKLKQAYPNFFLDTHEFIGILDGLKKKV